ncbi:hypothetical protein AB0Q95_23455 [Streptomyces sp. NPDC059900]|uniref:hypothetical protein n=1 Tax=Streptomyces sp. NPDC059900 TaxID=3155816 RepID=UPI003438EBB5
MDVLTLLATVLALTFEQFAHWQYGVTGLAGLLLLALGIKVKSHTCSSIGAVVLALMMTGPAI